MNVRFAWGFGLIFGFSTGLIVRDNYTFPYDKKIDIMHNDYNQMIKSVNIRMKEQNKNVNYLKRKYKQLEQLYLFKKQTQLFQKDTIQNVKQKQPQEKIQQQSKIRTK